MNAILRNTMPIFLVPFIVSGPTSVEPIKGTGRKLRTCCEKLQEHAKCLEKLGENESAQGIFLEALGLIHRLFGQGRVGMHFSESCIDFIFADGGTRFRLGQGLYHPGEYF